MQEQYPLEVGVLQAQETLRFNLLTPCLLNGREVIGEQVVRADELGDDEEWLYVPQVERPQFMLHDVIIGVNFHWQRKEDQVFEGSLKIIKENGLLTAVNLIGLEDYLTSVISSEMSATSSLELLKAHAVISRSWVMRPIVAPVAPVAPATPEKNEETNQPQAKSESPERQRLIRIYERDAHSRFHVCADDHCQRYQGITRLAAARDKVREAIEATWGQVLADEQDEVCDARFYKCCGGKTELFENCWADTHYSYLESIEDAPRAGARSFCNTRDARVLSQVLNNYDQETQDFYQWTVRYTQAELSELVRRRSGFDFGLIEALQPVKIGPSGRIVELRIVGEKRTMVVGKELEIRKWLSPSHLYSSAFEVEKVEDTFVLHGRGWGHGVGLCQIGAAVMADEGYAYEDILYHYFPNTHLRVL